MEDSKIKMKVEEETKSLKKIYETLEDSIKHEFEKGVEQIDVAEMKEAVDMLKDIAKTKKSIVESCYYMQIMEAMEESEYGEDYDYEGRRGYRGQPRSESGRFMSRGDGRRSNRGGRGRGRRGYEEPWDEMYDEMEYYRDMDLPNKMYYSGSGSNGGSSGMSGGASSGNTGHNMGGNSSGTISRESGSRYENARRGYEEKKTMGADKGEKMKSLEEYMKTIAEELTQAVEGASQEERTMIKAKLNTLATKM